MKRNEKLAFMQVEEGGKQVFRRMTGFTEFSISKNPKEYSRKYIDEDMERSEVVGYSTTVNYKFDIESDNSVHKALYKIADQELVGKDAEVVIVIADLCGGKSGTCSALKRAFSVIPASEGDDADTYTVSGSLRAAGEKVFGTATSSDDWQTLTFSGE